MEDLSLDPRMLLGGCDIVNAGIDKQHANSNQSDDNKNCKSGHFSFGHASTFSSFITRLLMISGCAIILFTRASHSPRKPGGPFIAQRDEAKPVVGE